MRPHIDGGEVVEPLRERVLGRILSKAVIDPLTGEELFLINTELDETAVAVFGCERDRPRVGPFPDYLRNTIRDLLYVLWA